MSVVEQVKQLKQKVENLRTEKVRAEERLKTLREQRDGVIQALQVIGLTPEQLSGEIQKLQDLISQEISKIETQIPGDH